MIENSIMTTRLTLKRKRQFMEANIPVDILVNGYLACQLKNGETTTINIHTHDSILLQAGLMMNKTKALNVNEADREQNIYEVAHVISNGIYFTGVALAIVSSILIFATGHVGYMALVAPPAALLLYFKFIKKDRYLRITPVKKKQAVLQNSVN